VSGREVSKLLEAAGVIARLAESCPAGEGKLYQPRFRYVLAASISEVYFCELQHLRAEAEAGTRGSVCPLLHILLGLRRRLPYGVQSQVRTHRRGSRIPDFFVGSDDLLRDAVPLVSAGRPDRVIQRLRTLERFDPLCMVESRHDAHQVELDGGVGVLVDEYPGRFSVGVSVDGHR